MSLPPLGPDGDSFKPPAPTKSTVAPTFAPPPEPPGPGYSGSGVPSTAKNWKAIVALILWFVPGGPLIGIFLAHGAVKAAKGGEATNKGLGIAALVVNYFAVGAVALLILAAAVFEDWTPGQSNDGNQGSGLQPAVDASADKTADPDDPDVPADEVDTTRVLDTSLETSEYWYGLRVGDCILDFYPPGAKDDEVLNVDGLEVVPCTEPHYGEVFVITAISGEDAPSDATYDYHLETICSGAPFEAYVGAQWRDSALYYDSLYPADGWWHDGNHEFVCLLVEEDEESNQAFRDSGI